MIWVGGPSGSPDDGAGQLAFGVFMSRRIHSARTARAEVGRYRKKDL